MGIGIKQPYNDRLFTKGLRRKIHSARFYWLKSKLKQLNCLPETVLELGCYDAKTINFLPETLKRYVGLDANFEGGLTLAQKNWNNSNFEFLYCTKIDDIKLNEKFDISICMETFEYITDELLEDYVIKLASLTNQFIFVTTSNQKGIIFALKHLLKKILGYDVQNYSVKEFFFITIGRLDKIKRDFRRCWDHKIIINMLKKHFEIVEITRYPFRFLPAFGICIVGKKSNH